MTKYNLLLIICCLFFSCEDFLDEVPKSEKTTIGTSLLDAQESVNGIYAYLRAPYNRTGYAKMVYSILEVSTGALKPAVTPMPQDFGTLIMEVLKPLILQLHPYLL